MPDTVVVNPHVFRAYDIRGVVGKEITPELAEALGRAFGTFLGAPCEGCVVVGRDNRPSSPGLVAALTTGLLSTGWRVIDIGLAPTPVLNFATVFWGAMGGINVTGSHNPPQENGFKLVSAGAYPVAEADLLHIRDIIQSRSFTSGHGALVHHDILPAYLARISRLVRPARPLRIVVDAGNGTTGPFAPRLLREIGCRVEELYCTPDSRFPNHLPNPEKAENMQDLQRGVLATGADIGFAYDGDGDRLGMVDERGERWTAEKVIILLSRDLLSRHPGAKILVDVKTSQTVMEDIAGHGGTPVLWKTGHSLIKRKMHQDGILLGGEASGHLFLAEDYLPIDDAMLASCRLAEIVSRANAPLSRLISDLPQRYSEAVDIPCADEDKFRVVARAADCLAAYYEILDIDGARINFGDGWALVRASNTGPALTLRFEAQSPERLAAIRCLVFAKLRELQIVVPD